jgi:hypothetical protein
MRRSSASKPSGSTFSISIAAAATPRDHAVGLDLGVVAHAPQQAVGDARRAARAARDLRRALAIAGDAEDARRAA